MELTPRTTEDSTDDAPPRRRPGRRWIPVAVLGVVVVALGAVVVKGLGEATLYYRNVDEAVAERDELGDRRFRMQGTVVDEPISTPDGVEFQVRYNDVGAVVRHQGDPPELFERGKPVVLEGRWDESGEFFASDRIMVKHDAEYESQEDYEERIAEAEEGGQ